MNLDMEDLRPKAKVADPKLLLEGAVPARETNRQLLQIRFFCTRSVQQTGQPRRIAALFVKKNNR